MENELLTKDGGNAAESENPAGRENRNLLLGSLLLGILCDYLFYGKTLGISYPVFLLAFYGVFLWNVGHKMTFGLRVEWLLCIPVLLLSATYFIHSNEVFAVLNFLGIAVLVAAQTTLAAKGNKFAWYMGQFIHDLLYGIFFRPLAYLAKPFRLLIYLVRKNSGIEKYAVAGKVLIGLLISVPLVAVVVSLLASADQVFGNFVGTIPDFLRDLNFFEFLFRSFLVLLAASLVFSYLWSFIRPETEEEAPPADAGGSSGFLRIWDPVILITVLCMINIIYVAFTAIQFAYLFGGVIPQGFTYAEYARRGFFELNVVTLINLCILLSVIRFVKAGPDGVNRTVRILNSLLVVCTLVMLLSAHYRMLMYEEAYGYTYLRILTHAFMAFIFMLLVATLWKVWNEKIYLLKAYIVIALVSYTILNYINMDVVIAKRNIERYRSTGNIDASYLAGLSYDAVPELVRLLEDAREDVALPIENGLYHKKELLARDTAWQAFNLSRYRAEKILSQYELQYREIWQSGPGR